MSTIIDASGTQAEVFIELATYKEAEARGMSVKQLINQKYPTDANHGSAFDQILASEGIFFNNDTENGIRATRLSAIFDGTSNISAGPIVRDGTVTSRIVFPAAILSALEDRLAQNYSMSADAFDKMIAFDDAINGDRFDRPILNFSDAEKARSQAISQLAKPNTMMQITVSEQSRRIPTMSLGMEISDQAVQNVTIDLVALAVARQIAVQRAERADEHIRYLLVGDVDQNMQPLSSIPGKVVNSSTLDSAATGGKLTQKAWMSWLIKNGRKRRITHIVTDIAGAIAIENREGRPTNFNDNPTSNRINNIPTVMNPTWEGAISIYITEDPLWPAGTIMGIDNRYAVARVSSLTAAYSGVERFALQRGTGFRVDSGEITYRLFDEAYEVLQLI